MTALFHQNAIQIVAVVPAAGIGSRMQADKPKQYLQIQGKTILEHSLERLLGYSAINEIILAVAKDDPYWADFPLKNHPKIRLVNGGENRSDSVLSGLKAIHLPETTWALVHDAARPCLTHSDLDKLLAIQDENGAILALPAVDTIKKSNAQNQIANTEDRNFIWLAQTPQYFKADVLIQALEQAKEKGIVVTDEASAMELAGFQPHLVAGRSDNIKVTRPEDLTLAEFYLNQQKSDK